MSLWKFVSPTTRFVAQLANATYRPSAEIAGDWATLFGSAPPELTLTRVVVPRIRSRTKTSSPSPGLPEFVSPGTRLLARLVKATKRPVAARTGRLEPEASLPCPADPRLTLV